VRRATLGYLLALPMNWRPLSATGPGPRPWLGLLCFTVAACGGSPELAHDPQIEQQFVDAQRAEEEAKSKVTFEADLLKLDQAIDKYATAWLTAELATGEKLKEKLENVIRPLVEKHFARLLTAADNRDYPAPRSIALAALGFSGRPEALDPMLNGARDGGPDIAVAALFGLAVLQDSNTPIPVLGGLMLDPKQTIEVRRNASLALLRVQEKAYEPDAPTPFWIQIIERPLDSEDHGVQMHAIRGLGQRRNPEHAKYAERVAGHPQPKVRVAAAIAMGRMKNESSVPALLALIGPMETNDNVRLAARKALTAISGGIDREYDVPAWRKLFERGNR
jgi:hypothetical protein